MILSIRNHIDGPLLTMRNGGHKWIGFWDNILLKLRVIDLKYLERKYWERPDYW